VLLSLGGYVRSPRMCNSGCANVLIATSMSMTDSPPLERPPLRIMAQMGQIIRKLYRFYSFFPLHICVSMTSYRQKLQ